jgi:hypothetical protein
MGFKDKINDSPVWWSLGLLVVGFTAGIGAISTGMSIFGFELVHKDSYLPNTKVEADYMKKKCGSMENYPIGPWVQLGADIPIIRNDNVISRADIVLKDPTHGIWYEGLGVAKKGTYPRTIEAPLTISQAPSPGGRVEIVATHGDLTNEPLATEADRKYVATSSLIVSDDGCTMSGGFTSDVAAGTITYCWQAAKLHNLCPDVRAKTD